ncbi:hypothetical protein FOZ60_005446 [Perkinsus olseni]|uniref:Uncharacterized protein n=1 Tax=Perkinsus olseni TaxID=32597 RepID=A0A7J6NR24_PEROL|nr:hypothetical protein FOZ60_005446 [Perkinsus olseni]
MPANKKTSETAAASHSGQQQQQGQIDVNKWMVDELGSLGLDGAAGAKLVTTLLEQHPRKADRVTQVRKYLTTAGFKRASANSISRTIVAVVEGSLPPTSLKDKVDTSSDREPHQRHQQQMSAGASDDLEFWSPSGEDSSHQPPDTPSPPRATTPPPRAKKVKPMKITGRDLTTMLGITQERSIQQYSDDEGHGGRVLTRHRKPLTTAPKGRAATGNLRPSSSSEFPRATMAGSMPRPAGVWADPTRSNDRSRSLSPELSEVYGTASRKGQVKLTGMQLLQVFDNARAQRKLKQDMAGRRLRNKADDGESSDDELNAAASSSADAFWQSPMEEPSPGSSVPGMMRTQRDKPRRLRGNKAHERPQDFEGEEEKNAKKAAPSAKKEAAKPEKSAPQLPVVASSDTMMLQLLAKHQAAEREEVERKKKAEEEERKRIEAEEEELRRQQEEEKARLEREGQWRKQREEAQQRQIELRKREEEQERKRQLEAAQKAEEDKRRMEIEKAVRKEKEEMMRQKEQEEKERQEREEALQKQRDEEPLDSRSWRPTDCGKENEEREAQAAKEAESGKEQQEQAFERKEAALAAMQAAMEAREKEFEEKMKAMQERLQQLEASKAESGGDNSQRNMQQQQQQQQIIDRQLSVISASRSNTAKQQCITSMKHFLQRLSRQYDIHVDTTSWKKRLETEGEGAAPTWNWCDQLLVFRPLDSRGSKVLPTPMPASMDTDTCEVRITHVMLCTNYVGLVIGDVQIEGQENRERLAAGVIVCGRSGGLPGQNKDTLDTDWTTQGVKEIKDSSLANQDHKHEDVYLQELDKPMLITAPSRDHHGQAEGPAGSGWVADHWNGTSAMA